MLAVILPLNDPAPKLSHPLNTICYGILEYYWKCDLKAEVDVNSNAVALCDRQHLLDVEETVMI